MLIGGVDRCDTCGKTDDVEKLRICSRFRIARFCSDECLKAAWIEGRHKDGCTEAWIPSRDEEMLAFSFETPGLIASLMDLMTPMGTVAASAGRAEVLAASFPEVHIVNDLD